MTATSHPRIELTSEDDRLCQALAYRESGYQGGELVVAWAVAALEQGLFTLNLAILAGLDAGDEFAIETHLELALAELQRPRPSPSSASWSYVRLVAERTASGDVPADAGLSELYGLWKLRELDSRLTRFVYLADDRDRIANGEEALFFRGLDEDSLEDTIRAEVGRFLSELGDDDR